MSSLQLWLAVLGGLVLAAVVAHNAWQTRRAGVRALPKPEAGPPAEAREPVFGDATAGSPAPAEPAAAAGAPAQPERVDPPLVVRRGTARLDALIDAIAPLTIEAPVSAETALLHLPPSRRAGSKPFLVEGLSTETGEWEQPTLGRSYGEFQAGVQMANRLGPLNEIEYSEFVQKVQAFADAIGAMPDFPDMLDIVARARELDAFASQHDAQLALRLRAKGAAWSLGYVQQHAARHGFVPGVIPGRLVLPAPEEGAPPVLSLQFDAQAAFADDPAQAAVRELTLAFDVPQTAPSGGPFQAWCAAGEALRLALDADLYDDGGQPLHPQSFTAIGQELEQLYAALAERDLAAGSPVARRLFS
jgi:hypothetical protein